MWMTLLAALLWTVEPAEAYRGERLVVTGKEVSVDGIPLGETRRDRFLALKARLESCPATAVTYRNQRTLVGAGQGISAGGLIGMTAVSVSNPYALGAVIGLAAVSLGGDVLMGVGLSKSKKLYSSLEAECLDETPPGPATEPLDLPD